MIFGLTTDDSNPVAILNIDGQKPTMISVVDIMQAKNTKCCKKCIGKKCHGECCKRCGGGCGDEIDYPREYRTVQGTFELFPNTKTRDTNYIAGKSGSGKSTWISKYLAQYKKMYPDNNIYLFSRLDEDDVLDQYKPIRIELNYELVDDPINPVEELSNSLCIFDDTDTIKDKKIKTAITELKNDLLEIGRHENIFVCIVSHLINNYKETRTILNESMYITFFPSAGSPHGIKYMLKNNMGLDKKQIERIMGLPSRWVTIKNSCPLAVIYEKGIYLL
jgi:hypothetical protein